MAVGGAIVLVRSLLIGSGARERAWSPFQLVSLVMVASVLAVAWHPVRVESPPWYDAVRVLGLAAMLASGPLVVWAYVRMGRYWDGLIGVVRDHRVVEEGPFALVRHPVYLGLMLFDVGGGLLLADPAVLAVALGTCALLVLRARAEERFLEERLGQAYGDYRRRVPMFVPRRRR